MTFTRELTGNLLEAGDDWRNVATLTRTLTAAMIGPVQTHKKDSVCVLLNVGGGSFDL